MRIVVFGATGDTGRQVVQQALERGHAVTAFVRDPASLGELAGRVTVVRGDVLQPDRVLEAVRGQDAVIFCVGVRRGSPVGTVLSSGTRNVVDAMRAAGVRRLIVQTGVMTSQSRARMAPFARLLSAAIRSQNPKMYGDKDVQEEVIQSSGLDWTIVRPPLIVHGPRTQTYRAGADVRPTFPAKVYYADVADYLLRQLDDRGLVGQAAWIRAG